MICADARDENAYKTLLHGEKAAFAFTDPPYNVPIDGHVCGLGRVRHQDFAMGCGEMSEAQFISLLQSAFVQMSTHSIPGAIHYVCMDWRHIPEIMAAGRAIYSELKNVCVWNKSNGGMGSFYRSKHELIFVWKSSKGRHINNFELGQHGRHRTNVWDYPGVSTFGPDRQSELAMHPTVKPAAMVADAIKDSSRRNGIVLDPFAGSGTILVAAERTGRRARAIEIDPHYCDVALQRWQLYSGKSAVHAATNRPFEPTANMHVEPRRKRSACR